jgi:rubrerythrin
MDKLKFNTNNYDNLFSGRASWLDSNPDFFTESDEPDDELDTDIDDVHSDLEDDSDDDNPDAEVEETETKETEETTDDGDGNKDVEIETSETEDAPKPTEGPDDYDLQDFGNHGGPDVPNNQYNEKDVEILNKLISSESDAINDYFDATTNTVDTNLSRLYGDIGREERFHLEQLMYAKSLITGEKYEPKDPEVKAEYEKLVGDGMDEDTAIITTMDKISIEKPMDDEEFEDLKEDVAQTESYLIQSEMFTEMMLDTEVYSKLVQEYATEMDIYMEDVLNTNTLPKREKYGVNPIRWMIEQFWKFIKFLRKLGKLIREHLARSRAKRNKIKAYISKYGPGAIFQKGYSFYTYNDHTGKFTLVDMIKTSDLLYRTTMIIAHNCGLRINEPAPINADRYGYKPLPVNSAEQGEKFINGMLLTKSRLNIVDNNEEYIINTLFGFSNIKTDRYTKTLDANGNEAVNHEQLSNNFYNQTLVTLDHITIAAQYAGEVAKEIENLEGVPDSIYRRNYETWKKSVNQMKSVMKGFQRIINAMNHDINTMLKIDEYVIQLTNEHDAAQQSGQPYNGETRYVDNAMNQSQQTQNNNQQKLVSRFA